MEVTAEDVRRRRLSAEKQSRAVAIQAARYSDSVAVSSPKFT
jgi:hypothetical protein